MVEAYIPILIFFLVAVAGFFATVISLAVIVFAVKSRRRRAGEVGVRIHG